MRVEKVKYHPGQNFVLDAAKELGYEIRDQNGYQTQGETKVSNPMLSCTLELNSVDNKKCVYLRF